jgi:hypothetical protein
MARLDPSVEWWKQPEGMSLIESWKEQDRAAGGREKRLLKLGDGKTLGGQSKPAISGHLKTGH